MDLAPPRTLQVVLPSRREANFQDFGFQLLHRFFINFRINFSMDFGTIFVPKSLQPGLQNLNKKLQFFNDFVIDFCSILASILGAIFLQNHLKRGGRVKHHHLSPLWGALWLRFPPFWIKFGMTFY